MKKNKEQRKNKKRMKLFLSWSGTRSHEIAKLFDKWIKRVVQSVEPWLSSNDLDKGTMWFKEIAKQLNDTENGIFFLTKSNLNAPWLLFEAGAISKGSGENNIFTFLIDLKTKDVGQPLAQFNNVTFNKESVFGLLKTINKKIEKSLDDNILQDVFETNWLFFEKEFNKILISTKEENIETIREEYDILSEVLGTIRSVDKFMYKLNENYKVVKMSSRLVPHHLIPIVWKKGKWNLSEQGKKMIDEILMPILNLGHKVVINSHTNSIGTSINNDILTQKRAEKVKEYVVKEKGVLSENIEAFGYGSRRLTNRCSNNVPCTEKEHKANIRTTFRIVDDFID